MEVINAGSVSVRNTEGKTPLGKTKEWMDSITIELSN